MRTFRVGDLRQAIAESNEFKPVLGRNVESDDKKNNQDAYKEIAKQTKSYDGGLTKSRSKTGGGISATDNLGMSDLRYDSVSQPFKDRVKAQLKGFTSTSQEKNHSKDKDEDFGNANYGTDKDYDVAKGHAKMAKQGKDSAAEIGLTGRQLDKKEIEKNDDTMFESKKIKRLTFKHTQFISEGHMLSKIPDEYKTEGNKFIMKDTANNEYLVEWSSKQPKVRKKVNLTEAKAEQNRMKQLWNYKSKDYFNNTTSQSRITEDKEFSDVLNKARKLLK